MLKTIFAAGALLAVSTSVAKVGFGPEGVNVSGKPISEASLQLRNAEGGVLLASKDVVESIGGIVEVTLDSGRIVTLEPGIRLKQTIDGYEISSHGRRPIHLTLDDGSLTVPSPTTVSAIDGGWQVGKDSSIKGTSLRAALLQQVDGSRVAAADGAATGGGGGASGGGSTSQPKPAAARTRMSIRRVTFYDPFPSAESVDGKTLKSTRPRDVSPSGF